MLSKTQVTYLVEVGKICDFIPQVLHDLAVFLVFLLCEVPFALNDGGPYRQTLEVILIQVSIIVDICNVRENFCKTSPG